MFGDFLYALTAKDAISAPVLQRQLERAIGAGVASVTATVQSQPTPGDKVCYVSNMTFQAAPGAAQTCQRLTATVIDSAGATIAVLCVFNPNPAIAAAVTVGHSFACDLLLFPGELIQLAGTFNAGANQNAVYLDLHKIHIPKGNLQLR